MKLTFRSLALGVAVVGLGFGASFAAGVAYGHGDPKTVSAGLTQQQLASLLGTSAITGTQSSGAQSSTTPAPGLTQRGMGGSGAAQLLSRSVTGRVTAIEGRTITVETANGSQKLNLGQSATLERVTAAATSDFKVGDTVLASGTRNADGTFDASSVSQVPQSLQGVVALAGGGAAPGAVPTVTSR